MTHVVVENAVPTRLVNDLNREIWRMMFSRIGWTVMENWARTAQWIPWLTSSPQVEALVAWFEQDRNLGERAGAQILLHPPDDETKEIAPHRDPHPEGRKLGAIVGIALTDQTEWNGCLRVWPYGRPIPVEHEKGDAVVMEPSTMHSGGVNHSGDVRAVLYYRWLAQ